MPLSLDIDENFDDLSDFENDDTTSTPTINVHRNASINSTSHFNNSSVDTSLSKLFGENGFDVDDSAKGNISDGGDFDLG